MITKSTIIKAALFFAIVALGLISASMATNIYRSATLESSLFQTNAGEFIGNPNAETKFVEFIDFTCIDCKNAYPIINEAVKQDGDIAIIPKPIFSNTPAGTAAAYATYAAGKQGKFLEAYRYFLTNDIPPRETFTEDVAKALDINKDQLETDMVATEIISRVEENFTALRHLGITAIPAFYSNKDDLLILDDNPANVGLFLKFFNDVKEK